MLTVYRLCLKQSNHSLADQKEPAPLHATSRAALPVRILLFYSYDSSTYNLNFITDMEVSVFPS